jgi:hypothetical protein
MSKYRQLISEARKPENKKARSSGTGQGTANADVNLSIKVSKSRRQHWAAEAKRQGTTLTAAITEALSAKFGEPG